MLKNLSTWWSRFIGSYLHQSTMESYETSFIRKPWVYALIHTLMSWHHDIWICCTISIFTEVQNMWTVFWATVGQLFNKQMGTKFKEFQYCKADRKAKGFTFTTECYTNWYRKFSNGSKVKAEDCRAITNVTSTKSLSLKSGLICKKTELSTQLDSSCHDSPVCFPFYLFLFLIPPYPLYLFTPLWTYLSLLAASIPSYPIAVSLYHLLMHLPHLSLTLLVLSLFLMDSWVFPLSPFIYTWPHCIRSTSPHVCAYIRCNIPRG